MKQPKLHGIHKTLFILRVKISVAWHFFLIFLQDRQFKRFILILTRLNYFIGKIAHNKFAQIGSNIRMDMYVPGFPSGAFYTACHKFAVFNEKLPCTVALISVTSACTYHCAHCYQRFDIGKDVELDKLIQAVRYLQDSGIAFFNIEGGEPFLTFDRLLKVCQNIDARSEIWVNTTGHMLSKERLLELKKANLTVIMFSLHAHTEEATNAFMGDPKAWQNMVEAIEICHSVGVPIAFNSCLSLADFRNGNFEKVMQQAKDFGGFLLQLIKPKPSGAWLESGVEEYGAADFELVKSKVKLYNDDPRYRDFPAISAQIMEEDPDMFGCTAGGTDRIYINAKGDVQPCEFLNISFGNIAQEDFGSIYKAMREVFAVPQTCIACEQYSREIARIYHDNGLKQLPLPKELTTQLCQSMKRNSPTRLYWKIEKEIR